MVAISLQPKQSEALIYSTLIDNGLPDQLAKIVTAQSGHETNGWISSVYIRNNNAFGYGWNGSDYSYYNNVEDSAKALVAYLQRRVADGNFPSLDQVTGIQQYATLLKNVVIDNQPAAYYEDLETNYEAGINRYYNASLGVASAGSSPGPGQEAGIGMLVAIALGIWLLSK